MKLSTKSRYGVRVLLDLALNGGGQPTPLIAVAERQAISARYLEQVAADLRKAGYVRSVKGAQGGYVLAMEPRSIALGPLIALLEGDLRLTDEPQGALAPVERCLNAQLFEPLNRAVEQYLNGRTLQDLVSDHQQRIDEGMYYL